MKKGILHLGTAHKHDSPFILASMFLYERAFPGQSEYFLLSGGSSDYDYHQKGVMIFKEGESQALVKLKEVIMDYKVVVLHGLNNFHAQLVLEVKDYPNFVWIFWGAEVYNNPLLYKENILGVTTLQWQRQNGLFSVANLKRMIRRYILPASLNVKIKHAAAKIKHVGISYQEEYENLKNRDVIKDDCRMLNYSYYPLEYVFDGKAEHTLNGNNILLGNSATLENNHLEVFKILKKFKGNGRKIITILSYGEEVYKNAILREGLNCFPDSFEPITNFMPLSEYNKLLQTCSIAIMNHYRQQGVGNILSLLWIGTKVFINEKNSIYHYLRRIGCYIYLVSEINDNNINEVLQPLTTEQANHNRSVLSKVLSTDQLVGDLRVYFANNFEIDLQHD